MKKQKHTQGPWDSRYIRLPEAVLTGWHIKSTNDAGTPVCVVPETIGGIKDANGRSPFQTANAQLIVAAPELLYRLEHIHLESMLNPNTTLRDYFESVAGIFVRAAIAKAKGIRSYGPKKSASRHAIPPTPTEGCWNCVEDSMPDDDIEVLVYRESHEDMYLAHHEDGAWVTDSSDEIAKVTHWMEVIHPTSSLQPKASGLNQP